MHFAETSLQIGCRDIDFHPRMLEDFLQSDPFVGLHQNSRNQVFSLLTNSLQFRN